MEITENAVFADLDYSGSKVGFEAVIETIAIHTARPYEILETVWEHAFQVAVAGKDIGLWGEKKNRRPELCILSNHSVEEPIW
ncbi:MAG: hypothetical protein JRN68_08575 [Nitrososphaerota archaeon]|nr:hypothetical protein [Nitrososphaerota archaeon]